MSKTPHQPSARRTAARLEWPGCQRDVVRRLEFATCTRWHPGTACAALGDKLSARPEGLYRLKGFVLTDDGGYEVQVVGRYVEARPARTDRTRLVGLGPADRVSRDQIEAWWSS